MFKAAGEAIFTDFIEKADFNKNKIADKKELQPMVSTMMEGASDVASSIDAVKASAALHNLDKECAVVMARLGPLVSEEALSKGLDVSALIAALSKEDTRIALAHIVVSIRELGSSIDHGKLQKGLSEFGEAKGKLEAFVKGAKPPEAKPPEAKPAKK